MNAPKVQEDTDAKEQENQCYFFNDLNIDDIDKKQVLGMKCLKNRSPEFVYGLGKRAISVHDLKCGVRNITNEESIESSEICWSNTSNKLGTVGKIYTQIFAFFGKSCQYHDFRTETYLK